MKILRQYFLVFLLLAGIAPAYAFDAVQRPPAFSWISSLDVIGLL